MFAGQPEAAPLRTCPQLVRQRGPASLEVKVMAQLHVTAV